MEQETKSIRFKRLAENRTTKILNLIDLLGNLSNTSFYEYSDVQVEKIFSAIESKVRENKNKFKKQNKNEDRRFTL